MQLCCFTHDTVSVSSPFRLTSAHCMAFTTWFSLPGFHDMAAIGRPSLRDLHLGGGISRSTSGESGLPDTQRPRHRGALQGIGPEPVPPLNAETVMSARGMGKRLESACLASLSTDMGLSRPQGIDSFRREKGHRLPKRRRPPGAGFGKYRACRAGDRSSLGRLPAPWPRH